MPTYDEVVAQLTGPGAPFEIATEQVGGRAMRCWKNREASMREKIASAGLQGDSTFIVQGEQCLTYESFTRQVWGAAKALEADYGFGRGDRLAVLAYNSPDWLVALFGAVSVGGIGVGINGWWSSEEIEYGLNDSGSKVLVVDERLYPRVEPLLGKLETVERIFLIGEQGRGTGGGTPAGAIPIGEILTPCDDPPTGPIEEDDPFVLLYTSGTTGRPKGCITTHRGTIAQITGIIFAGIAGIATGRSKAPIPAGDTQAASLLTSPLFHVGGLHSTFCTSMSIGSKVVFSQGRFDPVQTMELIERERITNWGAIPTMLHRVVHHERVRDFDLSSLANVSFGGAPTAPETIAKAREVLAIEPSFTNAYGLTETHGVATTNGGKDLLDKTTSAGRPMPLLDLEVRDEDGKALGDGTLGEICLRGPLITPGYWKRPEATAETVRDGWLHTGDLGYRDEDGFLFVVDRAKDMILRGGENVYCVEIENTLADHPEIDEAAIVGVPDTELGERVKAIVRRTPGSSLSENAVRSHVAAHLASFKVPEIVEFTADPLPRNPAGKLLKNALRGTGDVPFAQIPSAEEDPG